MTKLSKFIYITLPALFLTIQPVFAQNKTNKYGLTPAANNANYDVTGGTDVYTMVAIAVNGLLALIGFVFFYYIIKAGLQWMTAQGNKDSIGSAKSTIINSSIGLAILLAAYGLSNFVIDALSK